MKMQDELTREQLLDIFDTLGGSGTALDEADDLTLAAILTNTIARATDAGKLDRAMDRPLTFEWRAALTGRKIELDQLAKAAPRKVPAFPGMTVNVPERLASVTNFVDVNGVSREVRMVDGRRVVDVSPSEFRQVFLAGPIGLEWQLANEGNDALDRMRPGLHF